MQIWNKMYFFNGLCQFQNNYKNFFSIVPNEDKRTLSGEKVKLHCLAFEQKKFAHGHKESSINLQQRMSSLRRFSAKHQTDEQLWGVLRRESYAFAKGSYSWLHWGHTFYSLYHICNINTTWLRLQQFMITLKHRFKQ